MSNLFENRSLIMFKQVRQGCCSNFFKSSATKTPRHEGYRP